MNLERIHLGLQETWVWDTDLVVQATCFWNLFACIWGQEYNSIIILYKQMWFSNSRRTVPRGHSFDPGWQKERTCRILATFRKDIALPHWNYQKNSSLLMPCHLRSKTPPNGLEGWGPPKSAPPRLARKLLYNKNQPKGWQHLSFLVFLFGWKTHGNKYQMLLMKKILLTLLIRTTLLYHVLIEFHVSQLL